jgi:hypothetical protein
MLVGRALVAVTLHPDGDALDLVVIVSAGLAVAGLVIIVVRAVRRAAVRMHVAATIGAATLALAWQLVSSSPGFLLTRSTLTHTPTTAVDSHDHGQDRADDDLPGSAMLADHLLHLPSTDLIVTDEQHGAATLLADATQRETARYARPSQAHAEGYIALDAATAQRPILYLFDADFVRQGTWLDPGRPQALVYLRTTALTPSLIGAMFLAAAGEGPRLGGGLTVWFPHDGLCLGTDDRVVSRRSSERGCPAGSSRLPWHPESLHVWFFDNPNGRFAGQLTREALAIAQRQQSTTP